MDDEPVHIADYDPTWPARFDSERQLLEGVLQPWLAGPIEHVGSTAVPGLRAKPIIDIMTPVRSLEDSRSAIQAVEGLRYHYFAYRADIMHWFCKPSHAPPRTTPTGDRHRTAKLTTKCTPARTVATTSDAPGGSSRAAEMADSGH